MREFIAAAAVATTAACGAIYVGGNVPMARLEAHYAGEEKDYVPCFRVGRQIVLDAGRSWGYDHLAWEFEVTAPFSTGPNDHVQMSYTPSREGLETVRVFAIHDDGRVASDSISWVVHPASWDAYCQP